MSGECKDPARRRDAIAVEERDELGANRLERRVAGRARTSRHFSPHDACAVSRAGGRDARHVGGPVVDDDDRSFSSERPQTAVQIREPVAYWDDHCHIHPSPGRSSHRMGHSGVGEPSRELRCCRGTHRARSQLVECTDPGRAQPERSRRLPAEQDVGSNLLRGGVEADPRAMWQAGVDPGTSVGRAERRSGGGAVAWASRRTGDQGHGL